MAVAASVTLSVRYAVIRLANVTVDARDTDKVTNFDFNCVSETVLARDTASVL